MAGLVETAKAKRRNAKRAVKYYFTALLALMNRGRAGICHPTRHVRYSLDCSGSIAAARFFRNFQDRLTSFCDAAIS